MAPLTGEQAAKLTDRLYVELARRREEIDKFERYFRGEHPLAYASNAWRREHARRYEGFADNWCGLVGSAASERTELVDFRLGEATQDARSPAEKQLMRDWDVNALALKSAQGFLTSSIARRSAALVWADENAEPIVSWEHPAEMVVVYDEAGRELYALKAWVDGDRDAELATLYTRDEVWKFQRPLIMGQVVNGTTQAGLIVVGNLTAAPGPNWQPRPVEATGDDTWPIDNPLGELPVREFQHKPMLIGDPLSRIHGTVAMQDAVNMLWAYLFVAADFASMPARVVMGQEPPKLPILDANGQKIGEKTVEIEELARGRMLWLTGEKTSISSWDAAKLDVFTQVINVAVKAIASQTKTPIHYIVGDLGNVNGETLTATETPLAADVRDDHKSYGPKMRELFRLMSLVRGETAVADACRTGIVRWRNPETRSDSQLADAALKDRQIGFPLQWIAQERYGLSQAQIGRLMDMIANDPASTGLLRAVLPGSANPPPVTDMTDGNAEPSSGN